MLKSASGLRTPRYVRIWLLLAGEWMPLNLKGPVAAGIPGGLEDASWMIVNCRNRPVRRLLGILNSRMTSWDRWLVGIEQLVARHCAVLYRRIVDPGITDSPSEALDKYTDALGGDRQRRTRPIVH